MLCKEGKLDLCNMANKVTLGISITAIFISCLPNILIIVATIKKQSEMKLRDMILIGLAVCDLGQTCFGFSFELYAYYSGNTPLSLCRISGYITAASALSAISHLVALSLERCFSIVHPIFISNNFEYLKTKLVFTIYYYCCSLINFCPSSKLHLYIAGILLCVTSGHHRLVLLSCTERAKVNDKKLYETHR